MLEIFSSFFRATKHKNYCIEAFNLQMQYYYILPKRYAEQMLWGRFINSEGGPGHNIPADLHMEHLNKLQSVIWVPIKLLRQLSELGKPSAL